MTPIKVKRHDLLTAVIKLMHPKESSDTFGAVDLKSLLLSRKIADSNFSNMGIVD